MESSSSSGWFPVVIALCVLAILKPLIDTFFFTPLSKNLPPGPRFFPFIGNFRWLLRSFAQTEPFLNRLHAKYGPIVTVYVGRRPAIFVASHELAHRALVQNGASFADRPPPLITSRIMSSDQKNINTSFYGPTWRLFRRNLAAEILHPSRMRSFSKSRKWVLEVLMKRLGDQRGGEVVVVEHFQYAMFCLLVLMCFGDRLDEKAIRQVEDCQRRLLLNVGRFRILNFWPRLGKVVFRKRWQEFHHIRNHQREVLAPLIEARSKFIQGYRQTDGEQQERTVAYVDSLLQLELPEEKRKLNEGEIISLCSEFLNAGTDTTSTALQWIMANMVKYPHIQEKLYQEIRGVVAAGSEEVEEDHLQSMPYLKAVVLEGLRRHPPGHFVLPHAVTEDAELNGYKIPKKGSINFMVAQMGWDPKVWEDPMEFRPERFLGEGRGDEFDITGSREIRMMPFGVGRRICPGYVLAMLHLEYFLANLIWRFQWKPVGEVDLAEKLEFTVVMKNPLRALISPRLDELYIK
ncbi:hypothetical protein MLD38_040080 [Melastoma candidum]|uniref:Uncharacterized protein n=1 Tax=Melastoma candidum TaxID=119954 RepID=A0ACB9L527_9MYRT|nr:hypothetical protein MLD38_040080 [Melastoma candidum]